MAPPRSLPNGVLLRAHPGPSDGAAVRPFKLAGNLLPARSHRYRNGDMTIQ